MARRVSLIDVVNRYIKSGDVEMPVFSNSALRIQQELVKEAPNVKKIEKIISSDQSLASQVLKAANSSFYGGLVEILTISNAVVRLGMQEVGRIALLAASKDSFNSDNQLVNTMMKTLWQHSVGTALASFWIAKKCKYDELTGHAFFAGLLHDIGKLFVLVVLERIKKEYPNLELNENLVHESLNSLHCKQGVVLMEQWNMPESYCTVVRDHHEQNFDKSDVLLSIVRVADMLCRKIGIGMINEPDCDPASSLEAKILNLSEIDLAELEIVLEDTAALAN